MNRLFKGVVWGCVVCLYDGGGVFAQTDPGFGLGVQRDLNATLVSGDATPKKTSTQKGFYPLLFSDRIFEIADYFEDQFISRFSMPGIEADIGAGVSCCSERVLDYGIGSFPTPVCCDGCIWACLCE